MQIKTQWDITSQLSEWLSSINPQTSAGKNVEKREPLSLLVGMQTGAATVEGSMEIFQKNEKWMFFDPVVPFLGIYPKEPKTLI